MSNDPKDRERAAEDWFGTVIGSKANTGLCFAAGWAACEAKQAERIAELEAKVKTFTLRIAKLEAVVSAARIFHDWRRDSDEVSLDIAIAELDAFDDPLGGA